MADNTNGQEFNTPLGRIVWGHPLQPQDKTDDNNQKVMKDGQVIKQWSFGVAFPKAEFEAQIWPYLAAAAQAAFPSGIPQKFSYKYKDGDSPEAPYTNGRMGKPYNQRPGYPGHYVLTVSTELQAPNVVRFENGVYMQVQPGEIKTGDYVMLGLNVKGHAGQSPGLYVNPTLVLHAYNGEAIAGSYQADPTQVFGAAPQLAPPPAGAQPAGAATGPVGMMPGQMPGAPQPQYQQPGNAGMPGAMGGAMPAANPGMPMGGASAPSGMMPPPAHDFVQNAGMPQQQPAPGMMPGAPGAMPGMPGPR